MKSDAWKNIKQYKKNIRIFILKHFLTRELFFFLTGHKLNRQKIDKKINHLFLSKKYVFSTSVAPQTVISLTSYGKRIPELKYTLYSLIVQKLHPEKIVVYLSEEDFNSVPDEILVFTKFNIEFRKCINIKSYKKLLPALQDFPNHSIITADDDLYYPATWFMKLYQEHLQNPSLVLCHQYVEITYKNSLNSFKNWKINPRSYTSQRTNCILGGSGTLYPPGVLYSDATNYELITQLAPYADDIWFYFMCILNGTCIKQIEKPMRTLKYVDVYKEYEITPGETLTKINVNDGQNDVQLRNILDYYRIPEKRFIDFLNSEIDNLLEKLS
ncbi:MAG: hypothetical protein ACTTKD_07950 [Peptoanaerobacter stomatis]|uniref:hypothetical protein n=1 Tax=Peptoanaerobacter stomatis TaxID=796937 RepID=UPI003F9EED9B